MASVKFKAVLSKHMINAEKGEGLSREQSECEK
jgi:hypothetical protein